jgi:hypothetical protein
MLSIVKHNVKDCKDMVERINKMATAIKDALTNEEVFSNGKTIELYTYHLVTVVPTIPKLKGTINRIKYDETDWNEAKKICDIKDVELKVVELKEGFLGWIILRQNSFNFTIIRDRNKEIITTKSIWAPSVLTCTEDAYSGKKYIMCTATTLWALQNINKVIIPTPTDLVRLYMIENDITQLKDITIF